MKEQYCAKCKELINKKVYCSDCKYFCDWKIYSRLGVIHFRDGIPVEFSCSHPNNFIRKDTFLKSEKDWIFLPKDKNAKNDCDLFEPIKKEPEPEVKEKKRSFWWWKN